MKSAIDAPGRDPADPPREDGNRSLYQRRPGCVITGFILLIAALASPVAVPVIRHELSIAHMLTLVPRFLEANQIEHETLATGRAVFEVSGSSSQCSFVATHVVRLDGWPDEAEAAALVAKIEAQRFMSWPRPEDHAPLHVDAYIDRSDLTITVTNDGVESWFDPRCG